MCMEAPNLCGKSSFRFVERSHLSLLVPYCLSQEEKGFLD